MRLTNLILCAAALLWGGQYLSAQNYELVWSDEFEGNTLNPSVWNYETGTGDGGWGNGELQYYTDRTDNVNVSDGKLTITCKKENYQGSSYTSGRIHSRNLVMTKYGKIESLIKCPKGAAGVWPAFWLLGTGNGGNWPNCGEIDIMEMMCKNDASTWNEALTTYHWNTTGVGGNYSPGDYGLKVHFDEELGAAWRIYGLEWTPSAMTGYVCDKDGNNRKDICTIDISSASGGMEAFTDYEFYIVYNFAFGGSYVNGQTDPDFTSGEMVVDWVKIYQDRQTYPTSSFTDNSYALSDIPKINADYIRVLSDRSFDGSEANLSSAPFYIWTNTMEALSGTAYEGESSLGLKVGTSTWYGGGYQFNGSVFDYSNLNDYTLHFALKTSSTNPFTLTCGNSSIQFTPKSADKWEVYDLPVASTFPDINLNPSASFNLLSFNQGNGETGFGGRTFEWDDIYYYVPDGVSKANLVVSAQSNKIKAKNDETIITVSGSNLSDNVTISSSNSDFVLSATSITPVDGKFTQDITVKYIGTKTASSIISVTSGSVKSLGKVSSTISGLDGLTTDYITLSRETALDGSVLDWSAQSFYVWEGTLAGSNHTPYEGENCFSFEVKNSVWYGAGFVINQNLDYADLSRYKFHFAMNASNTQPVTIRICGKDTQITPAVANQWAEYEIKLADLGLNLDVASSIEPFSFCQGANEAVENGKKIAFDDVYFYIPGGSGIPAVSVSTPATINGQNGESSIMITGNNLSGVVSVSSSNPNFVLSKTSVSPTSGKVNETITISYTGIVADNGTITVKCGNLTKTVAIAALGQSVSSSCNLVPSFVDGGTFYATTWSWVTTTGHTFSVNGNAADIYIPNATVADFQSQFWLDPSQALSLEPGTKYTVKALVYADKAVTARLKTVQRGNDDLALCDEKTRIVAYSLTPVKFTAVALSGMTDMRVLFDFGGNPDDINIKILNLEIGLASCYGDDVEEDNNENTGNEGANENTGNEGGNENTGNEGNNENTGNSGNDNTEGNNENTGNTGNEGETGNESGNENEGGNEEPETPATLVTAEGLQYSYEFVQNGAEVTVTFTVLNPDDFVGLVPFMWNRTEGFSEAQGASHTFTYPAGTVMKFACKWAFAGGMTVTPDVEYTVLASSSENEGEGNENTGNEGNNENTGNEEPETPSTLVTAEGLQYSYEFVQNGEEVTVTFTVLNPDDFVGLVPFMWNRTEGFSEAQGASHTFTYPAGTVMKFACKWAFAGGMTVTPDVEYTVLTSSTENEGDGENTGNEENNENEGGNGNEEESTPTSINNAIDVQTVISVYPNPSVDYIVVNGTTEGQTVEIFNISGVKVLSEPTQDGKTTVSVSGLRNAIYVVKTGNKKASIIKK